MDDKNQIQERGDRGPYLQSKRLEHYHKYVLELVKNGSAYYCFCDEQRLDELRKEQVALKKPPMYDRHCRNLTPEEVIAETQRLETEGRKPVIRQAIPLEGETVLHDLIYGDITIDHKIWMTRSCLNPMVFRLTI